jgi:hypothetical protein
VAVGLSGYGNLAGDDDGLGFSLLSIVKPIASFVPGGNYITGGISLASGLTSTNAKDPERLATAQSNLQKALAGDANAYLLLQQQAGLIPGYGSATQYGKDVAKAALATYAAQRGAGVQPAAPVIMSPVVPAITSGIVTPTTTPTTDTTQPRINVNDLSGKGAGVSPVLLAGIALAAVMAIRGRR